MVFQKGYTPWNKGLTGIKTSNKGRIPWNRGKPCSEETKNKISRSLKGHILSKETRRKISKHHRENSNLGQFKKGHIPVNKFETGHSPWNKGLTKETDERIRESGEAISKSLQGNIPWSKGKIILQIRGENHWKWKGGISDKGYAKDWTEKLRDFIRARDNYVCQKCGLIQGELEYKLDVHHIDENKNNNSPENLITLCRSCHSYKHSELVRRNGESLQVVAA